MESNAFTKLIYDIHRPYDPCPRDYNEFINKFKD